jgi:hypothetical protein
LVEEYQLVSAPSPFHPSGLQAAGFSDGPKLESNFDIREARINFQLPFRFHVELGNIRLDWLRSVDPKACVDSRCNSSAESSRSWIRPLAVTKSSSHMAVPRCLIPRSVIDPPNGIAAHRKNFLAHPMPIKMVQRMSSPMHQSPLAYATSVDFGNLVMPVRPGGCPRV